MQVNHLRAISFVLAAACLVVMASFASVPVQGAPLSQAVPTNVFAEAIGEANLRGGPGLEYPVVGSIRAGTRYAILGRHETLPWLLLEYPPAGSGWVYADLVTTTAPSSAIPVVSGVLPSLPQPGTPSPGPSLTMSAPGTSASPASISGSVFAQTTAEVNVRFGPGVDTPRIGQLIPGQRYTVISRHALYPWILIEFPEAPDGLGWIFRDVVEISGDLFSLPVITVQEVGWPTLTPTPPFVVTSNPPWQEATTPTPSPVAAAVDLVALGDAIQTYLLSQGFVPEEERFGSVFLLDTATGQSISLGPGIAYSGMSLVKIPLMVEFYRQKDQPASALEAELITNTMICSGNHTANEMFALLGDGDQFAGAERITTTLNTLGLQNSFILAPFKLGEDAPVESRPIVSLETPADQQRAVPDPFNQATPEDLGWLLDAVYQCAMNESGPLMAAFPGQFTATECRQIILAMSRNQINVLTEAGVPVGTRVAHKHGWIDDTHGDAGIIFTPGGDFVLTITLYGRGWLPYEQSWPTIAEITRMVYNAYNPAEPLAAIHPATVDETCNLQTSPLLSELQQSIVPPLEDAS